MQCSQCEGLLKLAKTGTALVCELCQQELLVPGAIRTDDDVLVLGQPAKQDCPNCFTPLHMGILEGVAVEYCQGCAGVLVGDRDFSDIVRIRRANYTGAEETPKRLDQRELQKRRYCPGCDHLMGLHAYNGPSNVVIDSCFPCGIVWLDACELSRIIQAPGIRPAYH